MVKRQLLFICALLCSNFLQGQPITSVHPLITWHETQNWDYDSQQVGSSSDLQGTAIPSVFHSEFLEHPDAIRFAGESLLRVAALVNTFHPRIVMSRGRPFDVKDGDGNGMVNSVEFPPKRIWLSIKNLGDPILVTLTLENDLGKQYRAVYRFEQSPKLQFWEQQYDARRFIFSEQSFDNPMTEHQAKPPVSSWVRIRSIDIESASLAEEAGRDQLTLSSMSAEDRFNLHHALWPSPRVSRIDVVLGKVNLE